MDDKRMLPIQPNPTAVVDSAAVEKRAQQRLELAKRLRRERPKAGTRWLKELIEDYPDTDAAEEARRLVGE